MDGLMSPQIDPILRLPRVMEALGASRSTVYELVDRGDLARPIKLGKRAAGWPTSAVAECIERLKVRAGYDAKQTSPRTGQEHQSIGQPD